MGITGSKQKARKVGDFQKKSIVGSREQLVEWENLGFKIFKERMGEEEFQRKMKEADEPPPKPSHFSASQMARYVAKYQATFALKALLTRQRGTHAKGVGAIGTVTVLDNCNLPEHDFFKAGRIYPLRLRHSNLVRVDDAQLDVRAVSLKFADSDFESPLDLMMHTGEEAAFWNIVSFDKMITALAGGQKPFKEFCLENPWHFYLAIAVFRRAPDSFTDQHYYSWMAFHYKANDGIPRYAKFRLIPGDCREETGLMTEYDQRKPWVSDRWEEETKPESYLIPEFTNRLSKEAIRYKLQIQLHEVTPNDSHLILHAARAWDRENHPWEDLADVTVTSLLPIEVGERTRFSLDHHPSSVDILPAQTIYDYSSISYLRSKVYPASNKMSSKKPRRKISMEQTLDGAEYSIQVKTGNRKGAGTDAKVTLTITGTKGRTKPKLLDKWFHNDFIKGQEDTYVIQAEDVGEPIMIKLENDQGGLFHRSSDWFVDKVLIRSSNSRVPVYEFPCYAWVQRESVFFEGKAKLITDEQPEAVRKQRQLEIQNRQQIYKWGDDPNFIGLPGFIKAENAKNLPKDVRFTEEAIDDLYSAKHKALVNLGLVKLLNLFESWEDFQDYRKAFVSFVGSVPPAAEAWQDDSFYGSHYLNGCNPDTIRRCTEIPVKFPVTQELVDNLLDEGDTLNKALKDGRVYMVDFEILEGIPHYGQTDENLKRRYTCPALGLFYVRRNGDIVPIAIQLYQEPSETNPIWTPNDSEMDWIYAKMWLRNADTQWHQMITHLLRCHLFMEPISVACWRHLPSIHPLWKLLKPHVRGILAINTLGRERLIPAGGVADNTLSLGGGGHITLMKKYYKNMSWLSYDLPRVLKERGVLDATKLPGFYYRDDALRMWMAIKDYVRDIVSIYYHSEKDIERDTELQAWILDLHENGYPVREGESDHGFPASVKTADQLIHLLTIVIFTCSSQHAAVNFSQMDSFGFPPNSPALMRQPPPTKKNSVTMKDVMKSLPNKHQAGVTIATVYDLTRIFPDEIRRVSNSALSVALKH
ncbi:allene oxide synthase-lipoxygenase protein-like isoform X2 [Montipora foliosa]|uniref:allene oxide synthase-lipoxygenase protein-like isoform X2 n=1 Tax=Montipora foliosa TaxID=591990 RepID=UPI0035F18C36